MKNAMSPLSRRQFLRNGKYILAVPLLESIVSKNAAAAGLQPTRKFIVLYKPNGEYQGSWDLNGSALPSQLAALAPYRNDLTFIRGLNNAPAIGLGNHAPAITCFLTCAKYTRLVVNAQKSLDQVMGEALGRRPIAISGPYGTLGVTANNAGEYYCNLSWESPRPADRLGSPQEFFDSIFTGGSGIPAATIRSQKSLIDFVKGQVARLNGRAGKSDKEKLDEYLTGVRELEISLTDHSGDVRQCQADMTRPGETRLFETHCDLMLNLTLRALQCDRTSILTYVMDREFGNGCNAGGMGHHVASHYQGEAASFVTAYQAASRFYISKYASFLQKMKTTLDIDGTTLLSNSAVLFANGINDRHTFNDLHLILAGNAQGQLHPQGREVNVTAPLANLHVSLLRSMGVNRTTFGDSTGSLEGL